MSRQPPRSTPPKETDRGRSASFDRESGEVSGSGAGIGNPTGSEDYDDDLSVGSGGDHRAGGPSNAA